MAFVVSCFFFFFVGCRAMVHEKAGGYRHKVMVVFVAGEVAAFVTLILRDRGPLRVELELRTCAVELLALYLLLRR